MCRLLSEIDLIGMRPVRVSAGEVTYPPGGRLGPRWQHDVELVLVHSGSARITVDDDPPLLLQRDRVALLMPGHREYLEFDAHEETHHSWVQLGVTGSAPTELARAPRLLTASTALTELVREAADASGGRLAAALAAAAIWRYVADAQSGGDGPAGTVELARRHLELHLAHVDVSLHSLAAAVHVTPAHLVRRFRAELGVTPMAYLWQRRVAAGIELLTSTGLPVGEIAQRTGFRSVFHFSRRVKAATGMAPTELRQTGWSQPLPPAEYVDE
jgi:AraC-like DNA-binding protein